MRKIIIMDRAGARKNSYSDTTTARIIISIYDAMGKPVSFNPNNPSIKNILSISFDDIDGYGMFSMEKEHARKIAKLVSRYNDDVEIIVHCEAGISRSAGVAAALEEHFNGDGSVVFNNPEYIPNRWCYSLTLTTLKELDRNKR